MAGKYDNILQFTEEADLIIRGLSYGVDALYYNDNEWRRHPERLRAIRTIARMDHWAP
jgi:hypothetical protein